jgi:hypothetical protein
MLTVATPCSADRLAGIDLGYVHTPSSNYDAGLVYGAHLFEGSGKIGFGVMADRFVNSIAYQTQIKSGGQTIIYRYEETFSDFYVSILATYWLKNSGSSSRVLLAMGPQIHFLTATKEYKLENYAQSARTSRLGFGVMLHYQRRIWAFGDMALVLNTAYSWAQSGSLMLDEYTPPHESISITTITAGLAFPF